MNAPVAVPLSPDDDRLLKALQRRKANLEAQDDLIRFAQLLMPDPDHFDDPGFSLYRAAKHHRVIAAALEQVEIGAIRRLIINAPPRHGKSELTSRLFPAWYWGKNLDHSLIFATYNEKFAWDMGRDVRGYIESKAFEQIFEPVFLEGASVDRLENLQGGKIFFVGRGGSITGRGANGVIIDDPIKDRTEADSLATREKLWKWFNQVIKSRLLSATGWIVIITTRWHEDDLVGRLTDRSNPSYNAAEAAKWRIIDLPAIALDKDVLGRKRGQALWPERFPAPYLLEMKEGDPRGFQSLYQGSPTPESGNFFDATRVRTYASRHERPPDDKLRFYCASDHAVSLKQERDKTCLITAGIDDHHNIWVHEDLVWGRLSADKVVERMVDLMKKFRPMVWTAESGHISKSIGPFLRKRMLERHVFSAIYEMTPIADKKARAQSIHARMLMGMVYFPSFASWWPEALDEMLKFPFGVHDDFVDALAWLGLGLDRQVPMKPSRAKPDTGPKEGTFGWLKADTKRRERALKEQNGGW